jgi:hypothetical protein
MMKNVSSEKKNAISKINWEVLETFWAVQYEEDYLTTLTSNFINTSFLNVDFSNQFEKEKGFS